MFECGDAVQIMNVQLDRTCMEKNNKYAIKIFDSLYAIVHYSADLCSVTHTE